MIFCQIRKQIAGIAGIWTPTKKCKKLQKIAKNCRKNGILEGRRSAVGDILLRDV
jgi:hypothetical protein